VLTAYLNMAGIDPHSRDKLMTAANVGARTSMLAFRGEVGSSSFHFVGHLLYNEITPPMVMPKN